MKLGLDLSEVNRLKWEFFVLFLELGRAEETNYSAGGEAKVGNMAVRRVLVVNLNHIQIAIQNMLSVRLELKKHDSISELGMAGHHASAK